MNLISVVIPIYNAQDYIERAILSVLSPLSISEVEVLCIDDGSTDNSVKVVAKMQEQFPNIVLHRQQQSGPAVARNYGLSIATGQYVAFLDADDYVAPDAYASLYQYMVNSRADLIFHGYSVLKPSGEVISEVTVPSQTFEDGVQCFRYLTDNSFLPSACMSLYNLEFLRREQIFFPIDSHFEDSHFFRDVILASTKTCIVDKVFYYYVKYDQSRSMSRSYDNLLDHSNYFLANTRALKASGAPVNWLRQYDALALVTVLINTEALPARRLMADFFKSLLPQNTKVIIYGTGSSGLRLARVLKAAGLHELVFSDSDSNKAGKIIEGMVVIDPNDINQGHFADYKIIIASCYLVEISKFLLEKRVKNEIFTPLFSKFFQFFQLTNIAQYVDNERDMLPSEEQMEHKKDNGLQGERE